jgi:hypothetical protein
MLGFQLAYGALFAKVWVAYQFSASQQSAHLAASFRQVASNINDVIFNFKIFILINFIFIL